MARWMIFALAFPLTGCFNGLLLTPTHVGGPLSETVMADSESCLCRNKVAVIDVEGVIMNARTSGLLGDGDQRLVVYVLPSLAQANVRGGKVGVEIDADALGAVREIEHESDQDHGQSEPPPRLARLDHLMTLPHENKRPVRVTVR